MIYLVLVQSINDLNIYDILEPCYHSKTIKKVTPANTKLPKSFQHLGTTTKPLAVRTRMHGRAWPLRAPVRAGRVPSWQEFARGSRPSGVPCMVSSISLDSLPKEKCGQMCSYESGQMCNVSWFIARNSFFFFFGRRVYFLVVCEIARMVCCSLAEILVHFLLTWKVCIDIFIPSFPTKKSLTYI